MDQFIYHGIWFLIVFFLMFLGYYVLLLRKCKKNKIQSIREFVYLIRRFSLSQSNLPFKRVSLVVSLINAFILAFVSTFIMLLPVHTVWRLLIAFGLLFALIYSLYEIYGRHLKKYYKKG